MAMFSFNGDVLLMGVRTCKAMENSMSSKIKFKTDKFFSIVRLNIFELKTSLFFSKFLKSLKNSIFLRYMLKEI